MEYSIEHDRKSNVCTIKVTGEHKRPHDSHELLKAASVLANEHKCSCFLFDMRQATIIGRMFDAYETAIDPERFGFSRLFHIACVYASITKEDKFMEDVGVNRGAAAFKVFDDIDAARYWIQEK